MTLIRTVYRGFMVGCMVSYRPTDSSQSVTLQVKYPILVKKPIDVMKHRPTYNVLSVTLCKQSSVSFNKYLLSQF